MIRPQGGRSSLAVTDFSKSHGMPPCKQIWQNCAGSLSYSGLEGGRTGRSDRRFCTVPCLLDSACHATIAAGPLAGSKFLGNPIPTSLRRCDVVPPYRQHLRQRSSRHSRERRSAELKAKCRRSTQPVAPNAPVSANTEDAATSEMVLPKICYGQTSRLGRPRVPARTRGLPRKATRSGSGQCGA